jgi:hypothetical protein
MTSRTLFSGETGHNGLPTIDARVAMQMTGHKTQSVFERDNIVSPGDLTAAAAKLDAVSGHTNPLSAFSGEDASL